MIRMIEKEKMKVKNKKIEISLLEEDKVFPKNENIWSVGSNEIPFELNSYYLTYQEALRMCYVAYENEEGNEFTIYVDDNKKNKLKSGA
jgi:hypothetical protein